MTQNEIQNMANPLFVKDKSGQIIVRRDAMEAIRAIEIERKRLSAEYDKWKKALLDGMEEYGLKKAESDNLVVSYIEPTERYSTDTKKLWEDYSDIARECERYSEVKSSVRIRVNNRLTRRLFFDFSDFLRGGVYLHRHRNKNARRGNFAKVGTKRKGGYKTQRGCIKKESHAKRLFFFF